MTYDEIREQARAAVTELIEHTHLKEGDIFIVGCSSSEIKGANIGKGSDIDAAKAVGARIAYPRKRLDKMEGILKVRRRNI